MANNSDFRKHGNIVKVIIFFNIIILLGCTLLLIASIKSFTKENKLNKLRTYEIKKQSHKLEDIEIAEEMFKQELSIMFCDLQCIENIKKEARK